MAFRNKKLVYLATAGLLLLVVLVPFPSLTQKGKGMVRGALTPAERGVSSVWKRLSDTAAAVRGLGVAAEEKRALELKVVRIEAELSSLRGVEEDILSLRQAFKFQEEQAFSMIPCNVVSRNISGWWSSVRLGKGSSAGIEKNRAVISPDGLVGRTFEVNLFTTEVLLLSDPACRVSARISRLKKDGFGLVRGAGSSFKGHPKARMEFINKDVEVRVGDEVVTSGLSSAGGIFPRGVHIGYVEKVYRDDSGLFQHAEIIPRATTGLLDYLFVVSDTQKGGGQ